MNISARKKYWHKAVLHLYDTLYRIDHLPDGYIAADVAEGHGIRIEEMRMNPDEHVNSGPRFCELFDADEYDRLCQNPEYQEYQEEMNEELPEHRIQLNDPNDELYNTEDEGYHVQLMFAGCFVGDRKEPYPALAAPWQAIMYGPLP